MSTFARKQVQPQYPQDVPQEATGATAAEPSTSQDVGPTEPKVKRRARGKGRGKAAAKKAHERAIVSPAETLQKIDTMTQTDSDFEEYLHLSEEQFHDYQLYKEKQMMQKFMVETIQEADFADYDEK